MNKALLSIFLGLCYITVQSQSKDSVTVNFKLLFDYKPLQMNQSYVTVNKDTVTISTFKCYISDVAIQYTDQTVYHEKNSYHLLDSEIPNSMQIRFPKAKEKIISKVIFNIGIDSITNTSGALSGDLDPTKGMYWAWQSGYINLKIEGQSPSCKTRKQQFQFHLGGYLPPYNALRRKVIAVSNTNDNTINIGMDLAIFLAEVNLAITPTVMTPGKTAMELADMSTKMFYSE